MQVEYDIQVHLSQPMHAQIRRFSTTEGGDPAAYRPVDPDRFAVTLRLLVGPSDAEGEESFDVTICTPQWLGQECGRNGFVLGRHHLVVLSYDFASIRRILVKLVERYSGSTWQEVAAKVSRIAFWEFEDYDAAT